jgi:hypothetical protein
MNNEDRERLRAELAEIENDIQRVVDEQNIESLEATANDLPPLTNNSIHDYEAELSEIGERSKGIIDNLVKLYLGEDENLFNHEYISRKREKDADNFSKLDFLVTSSQRTLTSIMKEIDMGAGSPRMYEVLSMLQKEMRENIKMSSSNLTNIESFYKNMREDLGLSSAPAVAQQQIRDEGQIMNFENMNNQVDEWIRSKSKDSTDTNLQ